MTYRAAIAAKNYVEIKCQNLKGFCHPKLESHILERMFFLSKLHTQNFDPVTIKTKIKENRRIFS